MAIIAGRQAVMTWFCDMISNNVPTKMKIKRLNANLSKSSHSDGSKYHRPKTLETIFEVDKFFGSWLAKSD